MNGIREPPLDYTFVRIGRAAMRMLDVQASSLRNATLDPGAIQSPLCSGQRAHAMHALVHAVARTACMLRYGADSIAVLRGATSARRTAKTTAPFALLLLSFMLT